MSMKTIVLADDHAVVRQGLRALLEAEPDLEILAEAADGLEAVSLTEQFEPDVLIVDLMMPGLGGLEVASRVHQRHPKTQIVILSMHANEAYVVEAFKKGAVGYVLKESTAADLAQAVRTVCEGQRYLSPPLSERGMEAYSQKTETTELDIYETLTVREREVLHLTAEGRTSNEIAKRLLISPRTVETHRANLMRKLSLHNQADLIRYALRRGLLPMND